MKVNKNDMSSTDTSGILESFFAEICDYVNFACRGRNSFSQDFAICDDSYFTTDILLMSK